MGQTISKDNSVLKNWLDLRVQWEQVFKLNQTPNEELIKKWGWFKEITFTLISNALPIENRQEWYQLAQATLKDACSYFKATSSILLPEKKILLINSPSSLPSQEKLLEIFQIKPNLPVLTEASMEAELKRCQDWLQKKNQWEDIFFHSKAPNKTLKELRDEWVIFNTTSQAIIEKNSHELGLYSTLATEFNEKTKNINLEEKLKSIGLQKLEKDSFFTRFSQVTETFDILVNDLCVSEGQRDSLRRAKESILREIDAKKQKIMENYYLLPSAEEISYKNSCKTDASKIIQTQLINNDVLGDWGTKIGHALLNFIFHIPVQAYCAIKKEDPNKFFYSGKNQLQLAVEKLKTTIEQLKAENTEKNSMQL